MVFPGVEEAFGKSAGFGGVEECVRVGTESRVYDRLQQQSARHDAGRRDGSHELHIGTEVNSEGTNLTSRPCGGRERTGLKDQIGRHVAQRFLDRREAHFDL